MDNFFHILIISAIQGVTEFIPVSSSAHLNLFANFYGFQDQELILNVSAHFGSLIAVILFFKKEILNFSKNKKLFLKIIVASIPLFFFGYTIIEFKLISDLRSLEVIGWMTLIFGILLYLSDKFKLRLKMEEHFTFKNALIIGLFQALAIVPGVSRSGIIITAARLLKFKRQDAAKISFLMSIPALAGVSIFGFNSLINEANILLNLQSILTFIFSLIFSYLTIKYFLIYLKKFDFSLIITYRIILGIFILTFAYL